MKTNTIIIILGLLSQTLWGQLLSMKPYDTAFSYTKQKSFAEPRSIDFPNRHKLEAEWGVFFDTFEKLTDLSEDFLRVKSPYKNTYAPFETAEASPMAGKANSHKDNAYKLRLIEWQLSMRNPIIWEE
jgi:hypothetical protein